MPKSPLLELTDALYQQRLAKEVRKLLQSCLSAYFGPYKIRDVKFSRALAICQFKVIGSASWHNFKPYQIANQLSDHRGHEIVASREK